MTLESKENYPRHSKIVQNSLGFMPEVKPLHKPRGDLVLCALQLGNNTISYIFLSYSLPDFVLVLYIQWSVSSVFYIILYTFDCEFLMCAWPHWNSTHVEWITQLKYSEINK